MEREVWGKQLRAWRRASSRYARSALGLQFAWGCGSMDVYVCGRRTSRDDGGLVNGVCPLGVKGHQRMAALVIGGQPAGIEAGRWVCTYVGVWTYTEVWTYAGVRGREQPRYIQIDGVK